MVGRGLLVGWGLVSTHMAVHALVKLPLRSVGAHSPMTFKQTIKYIYQTGMSDPCPLFFSTPLRRYFSSGRPGDNGQGGIDVPAM